MNRIALIVFLASPLTILADDAPKSNLELTEKEFAEGWILLFDGKTTFGWTSPNEAKWTITDGMLAAQKDKEGLLVTTTAFRDYDLGVEYTVSKSGKLEIFPVCEEKGTGGWSIDLGEKARGEKKVLFYLTVKDGKQNGGAFVYPPQMIGSPLGKLGIPATAPTQARHLAIKGNGFIISKFVLKPKSTKLIPFGKDLGGWKVYDGDKTRIKSKFAVTKEGWLSLKDGPGDLQSEKQWADFVLQLECRTNGKHLNSGVFFRCLPGQYQMGYEAQIHNGFGDEKDYTLDVFDPKTNKPLDKKKEKYTALDYGTGAIYRRQPARFQASKDNEWFTMTVVARDRHFATWVNGIQQVDWTDNRPLGENARVGAYLKKGPISIQGHDPTTDLHFRNIRIVELPSK